MRKVVIVASGTVLMAASVLGNLYFSKLTEVKFTSIVTVKPIRLLKTGEIIDAHMLRQVSIPEAAHTTDAIKDMKQLIGKEILVPVGENEEIATWKVASPGTVPKDGERYYSFKTDPTENVNNMVRRGDAVDVWVEFDYPKVVRTPSGILSVGAVKIIEGLCVSAVKIADGSEVVDGIAIDNILQSDAEQLSNARGKPLGKAETNTYIMNDETYGAYTLGAIGGHIKLSLPNLNNRNVSPAKVTDTFRELQVANAFTKNNGEVTVKNNLKETDMQSNSATAKPSSQPIATPHATEVQK